MNRIVFKYLVKNCLTVLGIAFCFLLCLYILSAYEGAYEGCLTYIKSVKTDAWAVLDTSNNFMRGFSILSRSKMNEIAAASGVEAVYPLTVFLASLKFGQGFTTVFLTGYDPESGRGSPPHIIAGRLVAADDEIILDNSLVKKYGFVLGQMLDVNKRTLKLVGICTKANGIIIQYAFVSIRCVQRFMPIPGIITAVLLDLAEEQDQVLLQLRRQFPGLNFFSQEQFVKNNIAEVNNGFLPLLAVVCVLSALVLGIILALILFTSVIEKRQDFAIMKIIGARDFLIWKEVFLLAVKMAAAGSAAGIIFYFPVNVVVQYFMPEAVTVLLPVHYLGGTGVILLVSLAAAAIASLPIRKIYPLEVFAWKK